MASKLYDPLGMLSSITLVARLFIAELWERKFGWDQLLPPSLTAQWHTMEKEANAASHLAFRRWVHFDKAQPVSLHIYTDASKSAFGATAYLTQATHSFLIGSTSKIVSHSKGHLMIPQLELSAMLLGSQYCETLLDKIFTTFPFIFGLIPKLHYFGLLQSSSSSISYKTKSTLSTVHLPPLSGGIPHLKITLQISFPVVALLLRFNLLLCGSPCLCGFVISRLGLIGLNA